MGYWLPTSTIARDKVDRIVVVEMSSKKWGEGHFMPPICPFFHLYIVTQLLTTIWVQKRKTGLLLCSIPLKQKFS